MCGMPSACSAVSTNQGLSGLGGVLAAMLTAARVWTNDAGTRTSSRPLSRSSTASSSTKLNVPGPNCGGWTAASAGTVISAVIATARNTLCIGFWIQTIRTYQVGVGEISPTGIVANRQ